MTNSQTKSKKPFNLKSIFSKFKDGEKRLYLYSLLGILGLLIISLPWDDAFVSKLSLVSSMVALFVAWLAYKLQKKSDVDLKKMEGSIKILREEAAKIEEEGKKTQANVNKAYFLIERADAINKYPENETFKEINEAYQSFMRCLFDDEEYNVVIQAKNDFYLDYKIEIVKNEINAPRKEKCLGDYFYMVKIIAPAQAEVLGDEDLKKYESSPIKEGEYYACRFDEGRCSWVLCLRPEIGFDAKREFFEFHPSGSESEAEFIRSANQIMGFNQNKYPPAEYEKIDWFMIDQNGNFSRKGGSLFRLFKKEDQVFYTVNDSQLKSIYILKTWIIDPEKSAPAPVKSLVFENLRGHIKNKEFMQNLTNRIVQKIGLKSLPERIVDLKNYRENHHIKIPLNNNE